MQQQQNRPASTRAKGKTLADIVAKRPLSKNAPHTLSLVPLQTSAVVAWPREGLSEEDEHLWSYKCLEMNLKEAIKETNQEQMVAHYLAAVTCLFPSLKDDLVKDFADTGCELTPVYFPLNEGEHSEIAIIPGIVNVKKMVAMVMIVILFIYKNVSSTSYNNFLQRRLTALFSMVGYVRKTNEPAGVFISRDAAASFQTIAGQMIRTKRHVIEALMQFMVDPHWIGQACAYTAGILTWTGMAGLIFIIQMLCIPRSPVLRYPGIQGEFANLYFAIKEVCNFDTPQYFRILANPDQTQKIERANFSVLLAVAQELKAKQSTTAGQFMSSTTTNNAFVSKLVALHEHEYNETNNESMDRVQKFVTSFMDDEDM